MGDMNMHAITVEMPTLLRYVHQFQKKKKKCSVSNKDNPARPEKPNIANRRPEHPCPTPNMGEPVKPHHRKPQDILLRITTSV